MTQGNTFKRQDPLVAFYDPKKLLRPKGKVKLEVQGKIFSCTPWQTYSKLFGMYDQQNVQFIVSFIFFSSI